MTRPIQFNISEVAVHRLYGNPVCSKRSKDAENSNFHEASHPTSKRPIESVTVPSKSGATETQKFSSEDNLGVNSI